MLLKSYGRSNKIHQDPVSSSVKFIGFFVESPLNHLNNIDSFVTSLSKAIHCPIPTAGNNNQLNKPDFYQMQLNTLKCDDNHTH